jgi:hypothetical protein
MKKILLIASLSMPFAVQASTVSLSTSRTGAAAFLADGTTLAGTGNLIRVGMISNLADPVGSFVEFGTGATRTIITATSKITGSVTSPLAESQHTQFDNKTLYIWVYNSPNALTASQQGIFASNKAFPVNDVAGVGDDVLVTSATDFVGVVEIPGWVPAQIVTGDAANNPKFVLGGVIPEPTSTTLSGLVALGFLARRKRA